MHKGGWVKPAWGCLLSCHVEGGRGPMWADSDREAGWAPLGLLGDSSNPRGSPSHLFFSKSHLQSQHHPLPAAEHLTVKTTVPAASQAPSSLLGLRSFLGSHHPLLLLSPLSPASAPSSGFQKQHPFSCLLLWKTASVTRHWHDIECTADKQRWSTL